MVFLLMGLVSAVQAQVSAPSVTNVRAVQRTGTKIVDITYDLSHPGNLLSFVSLEVSQDGGVTYAPVTTVSGALGPGIFAGTGRAIEWRAATDWTPAVFNNVKVRVKADDAQDMVLVPGGPFEMGYGVYTPTVTVSVSAFLMSRTEVTSRDWSYVREWGLTRGYNDLPSKEPEAKQPVAGTTWYEAVKWLNAKSEMDGLAPVYFAATDRLEVYRRGNVALTAAHVNWLSDGYRLPTDAEWEKAARGGIERQMYATGISISKSQADYGRYYDWGRGDIARFSPTGYGLFDIAGSVWEWCWDFHSTILPSGADPVGPTSGGYRIIRGGAYTSHGETSPPADLPVLKLASRTALNPGDPGSYRINAIRYTEDVGFRIVRRVAP